MKTTTISFKKPANVLQVFNNVLSYGKDEKSFANRQHKLDWQPVMAMHGGVVEGQLLLPEAITAHSRLAQCDLITILDDTSKVRHHQRDFESNNCLVLDVPRPLSIFNLLQKEELELHLRYNYFYVGIPERADFKICTLYSGEPVEVKINGKPISHLRVGVPVRS